MQTPPSPAASSNAPLKLSLSTLLKGYSVTDLGFDSGMVPSWIMTSIPSSTVSEQMASGNAKVELGLLIDGTTDIGFRNVLSSARRDVLIQLPANELFHGLPTTSPAAQVPAQTAVVPAPEVAPSPASPPGFAFSPAASITPAQTTNPFAAAKAAAAARSGPLLPPTVAASVSGPIQPKANANFGFATPAPAPLPAPVPEPVVAPKQVTSFDPFAATSAQTWNGQTPPPVFPRPQTAEGFSSEQLFGTPAPLPAAPAPQPPVMPSFQEAPAPVIEQAPRSFTPLPGIPPPPAAPSGAGFLTGTALQSATPAPSFLPPPVVNPFTGPLKVAQPPPQVMKPFTGALNAAPPPPALSFAPPTAPLQQAAPMFQAPVPPPAPPAPPSPAASSSILGITPVAPGDTEQVMLRALLGVSENLTVGRVVELISQLPGIAACSCVNGSSTVSHGGSSQTAQDFQRQAAELARSIHALAPLIGISGAETFSINTNERLMTFAFHPPIALGVLHEDNDLAAGLRDKITLVSRELSRMVAKTGGHIA